MSKNVRPTNWFTGITAFGIVAAVLSIVGSWLEHIFYVMGPGPSQADWAAFHADVRMAPVIVGIAVLFAGSATVLVWWALERSDSQSNSADWSEKYRTEARRRPKC